MTFLWVASSACQCSGHTPHSNYPNDTDTRHHKSNRRSLCPILILDSLIWIFVGQWSHIGAQDQESQLAVHSSNQTNKIVFRLGASADNFKQTFSCFKLIFPVYMYCKSKLKAFDLTSLISIRSQFDSFMPLNNNALKMQTVIVIDKLMAAESLRGGLPEVCGSWCENNFVGFKLDAFDHDPHVAIVGIVVQITCETKTPVHVVELEHEQNSKSLVPISVDSCLTWLMSP